MKIINFVPQQKTETNPLIKMNCSIPENSNKNFLTVHNEKEKITKLEIQINELKNSLNDCEQDKIFISM